MPLVVQTRLRTREQDKTEPGTPNFQGNMEKKFPDNILLGFGSAAYQIEGGWNSNGKGENIWDTFTHISPEKIVDKSNGDIACDSYNKYREDVQLIKELGGQIYRFSLSWSRILPKGFPNEINQSGINYYVDLIDELIEYEIEPMVTLYHWDLPQPLQDLGGWPNPNLADYFCDYAEIAFKNFGAKVKKWVTFNEPEMHCTLSYGIGSFAPGIAMPGLADYQAGHTMLKAHAKAYRLYDKKFRAQQKGEIGIALNMAWPEPRTSSTKDTDAVNDFMDFYVNWFAHPIFSPDGDYPEKMKKRVAILSKNDGWTKSRLPEFDQYWINQIKGSSDFFGLNHYTSLMVSHKESDNPPEKHLRLPSRLKDARVTLSASPDWVKLNSWFYIVPWGFRKCLQWIKHTHGNPKIYVTENGCLDKGTLEDNHRIVYYQEYLSEMLKAINEDGCRVGVYAAWSLLDNFEWSVGYADKFGIFQVDFKDPRRKRTPKKSAEFIKDIYYNRCLPKDLREYVY